MSGITGCAPRFLSCRFDAALQDVRRRGWSMVASRLLSLVFALALAAAPANAASSAAAGGWNAPAGGQAGSACGVVDQSQYWLCKALEEGNCGLTSVSEEYWFCKGIVDRQ